MNALDWLKQHSVVVADTGDFDEIAQFSPRDATTNPSLILKAVQQPRYAALLQGLSGLDPVEATDRLLVRFGLEILQRVPGRVSTEVDARLAFDSINSLARARRLIALFEAEGIARDRVLIKLAATWEGIEAARVLEQEGIHCNLTLVFARAQALTCARAGVKLISPFVGRIYDWHKQRAGAGWDEATHAGALDPGVRSVLAIMGEFARLDARTEIMGASFRKIGQVLALAGCDLLTVSPALLASLKATEAPGDLERCQPLTDDQAALEPTESAFRLALNDDAMATEKLAEGIRLFCQDGARLEGVMRAL